MFAIRISIINLTRFSSSKVGLLLFSDINIVVCMSGWTSLRTAITSTRVGKWRAVYVDRVVLPSRWGKGLIKWVRSQIRQATNDACLLSLIFLWGWTAFSSRITTIAINISKMRDTSVSIYEPAWSLVNCGYTQMCWHLCIILILWAGWLWALVGWWLRCSELLRSIAVHIQVVVLVPVVVRLNGQTFQLKGTNIGDDVYGLSDKLYKSQQKILCGTDHSPCNWEDLWIVRDAIPHVSRNLDSAWDSIS
jgi:hypothetical protein